MAEFFSFKTGRRIDQPKAPGKEDPKETGTENAPEAAKDFYPGLDVKLVSDMGRSLDDLALMDPESHDEESVREALRQLETAVKKELLDEVHNSNSLGWELRPNYYRAVLIRMRDLNMIPQRGII